MAKPRFKIPLPITYWQNPPTSSEDEESDDTSVSVTEEESESSEITEENILELIQEELENYRNNAHSQANNAYSNAGMLGSLMASQQQTLASL